MFALCNFSTKSFFKKKNITCILDSLSKDTIDSKAWQFISAAAFLPVEQSSCPWSSIEEFFVAFVRGHFAHVPAKFAKRPNQFSGLLTTFNQSSIKVAALSPAPHQYVSQRASCLCLLTDDQKEASVPSYLHLTLLSNQLSHERETRTPLK